MLLLWLVLIACLGYTISIASLISITVLVCTLSTSSMVCLVSSMSLIGVSIVICMCCLIVIGSMIGLTFLANLLVRPSHGHNAASQGFLVKSEHKF